MSQAIICRGSHQKRGDGGREKEKLGVNSGGSKTKHRGLTRMIRKKGDCIESS